MYRTQTRMIEGELCRRIRSQKFPTPSDGARTQFDFTFVDASRKKECNQGRPNSVMPSDVM